VESFAYVSIVLRVEVSASC